MSAITSTAVGAALRHARREVAVFLIAAALIGVSLLCATASSAYAAPTRTPDASDSSAIDMSSLRSVPLPSTFPEQHLAGALGSGVLGSRDAARSRARNRGPTGPARFSSQMEDEVRADAVISSVTGPNGFAIPVSLTGRPLAQGEFTIQLVEDEKVVATGTNDACGNTRMGAVRYAKPGVHHYEIREERGDEPGISYSSAAWKITTEVTSGSDGVLEVHHRSDGGAQPSFRNAYRAIPVSFSLTDLVDIRTELIASKQTEGEFDVALVRAGTLVASGRSRGRGVVRMGPATFAEPGVYDCELVEQPGERPGVAYDETRYHLIVTITDSLDGYLRARVDPQQGMKRFTFKNRYAVKPLSSSVTDRLDIRTQLDGRALGADGLGFELLEGADVVGAGTSDAAGRVTLPQITYTQVGHHVYALRATPGDLVGVMCDQRIYSIAADVIDDGSANLSVRYALDKDDGSHQITFKSSYAPVPTAGSVTDQIPITVHLQNNTMVKDEFNFEVVEGDSVVSTGTSDEGGAVTLAPILYDRPGEHLYTVREIKGTDPHITYDSETAWRIRTRVADAGDGTFSISHRQMWTRNTIRFSNIYMFEISSSISDEIPVRCELRGRPAIEGEFSFQLLEGDRIVSTGKTSADGSVRLTPITYVSPGVRRYSLRQASELASGVTRDTATYSIVTTITKDGSGRLRASHRPGFKGDRITFVNSYAPAPLNSALTDAISVSVTLAGRDSKPLAAGEFTVELVEGQAVAASGKNDAQGRVSMDPIRYTEAGRHAYTMRERRGSTDGVTCDERVYQVSAVITDDGNGALHAAYTLDTTEMTVAFRNVYSCAPTPSSLTDQIDIVDRLFGRALADGEFSFEILEDGNVVASGKNDAAGKVTMEPITYDAPGQHAYTLHEVPGKLGGVTYDKSIYTVTVTVTDGNRGSFRVRYGLKGAGSRVSFENSYAAAPLSVSLTDQIPARVELAGRKLANKEFALELREGAAVVASGTNDASGAVKMGVVRYTGAGRHSCTLSEVKRSAGGMTMDGAAYDLEINVTDNGDGTLCASCRLKGEIAGNGVIFKNSYHTVPVSSSVTDQILIDQQLTGQDSIAGEFAFELLEGAQVVARGTSDIDGDVKMSAISYAATGEHRYTLREVPGDRAGIGYDTTVYEITTTLTDNGDGTLGVRHRAKDDSGRIEFKNSYSVAPTKASPSDQIEISTTLDGQALTAGEFTFELDRGDVSVANAINDAAGRVVLPPLNFTTTGTFRFRLHEVAGTAGGISYDAAVHIITATVTDSAGSLSAAFTVDEGGDRISFANAYTASPTPARLTDQIEIVQELAGRALRDRELSYELVEGDQVVARGVNRSDGVVKFDPVSFAEAGTHTYTLREEKGDEDDMEYDQSVFNVTATSADAGDGTYKVVYAIEDARHRIVFKNRYSRSAESSAQQPARHDAGGDRGIPVTGDAAISIVAALALAAIVAAGLIHRSRRHRKTPFPPLRRL
ncbi:LPXTG-motif cell wall anchor domain protein [Coriobacterium glomerans PW2]|uniref:LPXTG-motif cell wall anchor domain protein n=1 Tax=Coriobacterium glomerans (strain ATCC 49209 / DSM 20642 / JCM 10262 / PW2) TaxID=700015 RepID=F2N6Z0_CORGP|nr:FctA domain-containing protein [Coriobacterium glomerans]AEB06189.1 LPXTG-motif cell wall anchor domain protein [Coriobacterium glomerans PW2]